MATSSIFWNLPGWLSPDPIRAAWWGLDLITPPVDEPVSLQDIKDHEHIDVTGDDATLATFLVAARMQVERDLNRSLLPTQWDFWLQRWPPDQITLPRAPLISLDAFEYTDLAETALPVPTTVYRATPTKDQLGYVTKLFGQVWPPAPLSPNRPIHLRFTAGYGYFSGTVDVTAQNIVTVKSGDAFDLTVFRPMHTICIAGTSYPIATVIDGQNLAIINATPGVQSGVSYTYNTVPMPIKLVIRRLAASYYLEQRELDVNQALDRTYRNALAQWRLNPYGLSQQASQPS